MSFHQLKHFNRIYTLQEDGYKSFALIGGPDSNNDFCVTLVRCKENKVKAEIKRWGFFNDEEIEIIQSLGHGETYEPNSETKVIRLS